MEYSKKMALLEETMEVEEGTLSEEMELENIEEYDSMARLSLIVMIEDEFGKKITADDIKAFKTVGDILNIME